MDKILLHKLHAIATDLRKRANEIDTIIETMELDAQEEEARKYPMYDYDAEYRAWQKKVERPSNPPTEQRWRYHDEE